MLKNTFSFWRRLVGTDGSPSVALRENDEDRRIWVRYPADVQTTVQPTSRNEQTRLAAFIEDVSQGGAKITTGHALTEGDLITLELPINGRPQSVLACIVRVNQEKDQRWTIGCVFSQELAHEELQAYGARREKHNDSDQRHWVRYRCTTHASFQRVDLPCEEHSAEVLDISANGVGLIVDAAIEPGILLNIELSSGAGQARQAILGCVVHVSQHGDGKWALGCNFIRELSEQDLLALR